MFTKEDVKSSKLTCGIPAEPSWFITFVIFRQLSILRRMPTIRKSTVMTLAQHYRSIGANMSLKTLA